LSTAWVGILFRMSLAAWISRPVAGARGVLARVLPGRGEKLDGAAGSESDVLRVDLPEAIGEPVEELREVHDQIAALPRLGPEEAEAESRTRPSGLTLYDEIRQEDEQDRHSVVEHLSDPRELEREED
jgi:hypothetical protein